MGPSRSAATSASVGGNGTAGSHQHRRHQPGAGAPSVSPITCGEPDVRCQHANAAARAWRASAASASDQDCGGAVLGCTVNEDCAGSRHLLHQHHRATSTPRPAAKPGCDNGGNGRDRQLCQTDDECLPAVSLLHADHLRREHLHPPRAVELSSRFSAVARLGTRGATGSIFCPSVSSAPAICTSRSPR